MGIGMFEGTPTFDPGVYKFNMSAQPVCHSLVGNVCNVPGPGVDGIGKIRFNFKPDGIASGGHTRQHRRSNAEERVYHNIPFSRIHIDQPEGQFKGIGGTADSDGIIDQFLRGALQVHPYIGKTRYCALPRTVRWHDDFVFPSHFQIPVFPLCGR